MPDEATFAKLQSSADERFVRLRRELGVNSFGLNQIILQPGQQQRIHRHTGQEEVYIPLEGVLTLFIEGEPHELTAGDVVRVPPSVRRQLVNRHNTPLSLLALGGLASHEHEPRDAEAFAGWDSSEPGTPQTVPLPDDLTAAELVA